MKPKTEVDLSVSANTLAAERHMALWRPPTPGTRPAVLTLWDFLVAPYVNRSRVETYIIRTSLFAGVSRG